MKKIKQYRPKHLKCKKYKPKNKNRDERQKLYQSARWRNYRFKFLKHNKHCYACGESEYKIHLDHIVAHKGDEEKFYDPHNIIPLCVYCHNTVTSRFEKTQEVDLKGKAEWIQEMRRQRGLTFSIKFVGEI